ncbi:RNA methyltransferase [bacterium]|nr:RNA methyltransferase [bacterium]
MITERRKKRLQEVIERRQEGAIVLEDIHDPHNACAVFRCADAFGIQKVYLIFEQEEKFNPRKIGKATSASANKWLDFYIFEDTKECLKTLKKEGYTLYATVVDPTATSIYETKFKERKIAILIGNEHRGLSEKAVALADKKIYIPMRGMVESLNLSVTAGIVLFELTRQRQQTGKDFSLSSAEKKRLWQKFVQK